MSVWSLLRGRARRLPSIDALASAARKWCRASSDILVIIMRRVKFQHHSSGERVSAHARYEEELAAVLERPLAELGFSPSFGGVPTDPNMFAALYEAPASLLDLKFPEADRDRDGEVSDSMVDLWFCVDEAKQLAYVMLETTSFVFERTGSAEMSWRNLARDVFIPAVDRLYVELRASP